MKKTFRRFQLPIQKLPWLADWRIKRRLKAAGAATPGGSWYLAPYAMAAACAIVAVVGYQWFGATPQDLWLEDRAVDDGAQEAVAELMPLSAEPMLLKIAPDSLGDDVVMMADDQAVPMPRAAKAPIMEADLAFESEMMPAVMMAESQMMPATMNADFDATAGTSMTHDDTPINFVDIERITIQDIGSGVHVWQISFYPYEGEVMVERFSQSEANQSEVVAFVQQYLLQELNLKYELDEVESLIEWLEPEAGV